MESRIGIKRYSKAPTKDSVLILASLVIKIFNAAVSLSQAKSVQLDTSSLMSALGRGYPSAQGTGRGRTNWQGGSGAGHGGTGGQGKETTVGVAYGSVTKPDQFGSGGGRGTQDLVCK